MTRWELSGGQRPGALLGFVLLRLPANSLEVGRSLPRHTSQAVMMSPLEFSRADTLQCILVVAQATVQKYAAPSDLHLEGTLYFPDL